MDAFTWNDKNDPARRAIERFLTEAEARADDCPERLPMKATNARQAISWLRGLLDTKPSMMNYRQRG